MAADRRSAVAARRRGAQAWRQGFLRGQGRPLRLGWALRLSRAELHQQESVEDEKWPNSFERSSLATSPKMESKDDTADAGGFVNGVRHWFGGGASARNVRKQGGRKRRP